MHKLTIMHRQIAIERAPAFGNRNPMRRAKTHPITLDGRYFVVRGRLWRRSNPHLDEAQRAKLVAELMSARRAKQAAMQAGNAEAREAARTRVNAVKILLGERGPVWWSDGAPDFNRHLARTTPYAEWFAGLSS